MKPQPCPAVYVDQSLMTQMGAWGPDRKFSKWVQDMKAVLLVNMIAGEAIQKRLIPNCYKLNHNVNNLYRYQHPEGYRSCYSLVYREEYGCVCPVILDLLSHAEYDATFGYETT